jgi:hypothetical protein
MTNDELTTIEARATAATREPWVVGDAYLPVSLSAVSVYGMGMEVAECQMPADGAFIAHARVDVPALIAEVRRLRALVESAYIEAAFNATQCWGDTSREREELIAGHTFDWQHSDARKALEVQP